MSFSMHSGWPSRGETLPDMVAGIPKEKIYEAVEVMKSGRFGVIFFGMGVTQSLGKNHNIDEAIMVTKDMNEYTKFAIIADAGPLQCDRFRAGARLAVRVPVLCRPLPRIRPVQPG